MAPRPKAGGTPVSEINVTPLVDVMLVLLVIFMVTATVIKAEQDQNRQLENTELPVTLENPEVVDILTTDRLVLVIDGNMRIYLGDELITDCSEVLETRSFESFVPCFDEIRLKLGLNPKLAEDHELYIIADTNIPYGFVVGTLSRLRDAGLDRVGMITNPDYALEAMTQ